MPANDYPIGNVNASTWLDYEKDAQLYLDRDVFKGTPIVGSDLSAAAKKTYERTKKYIPVEIALAQMQGESSMGTKGRSPKTNPYNVGEFDKKTTITYKTKQEGIQAYYDLIADDYLIEGVGLGDLLGDFVNKDGNRYATNPEYEKYMRTQTTYIERFLEKGSLPTPANAVPNKNNQINREGLPTTPFYKDNSGVMRRLISGQP